MQIERFNYDAQDISMSAVVVAYSLLDGWLLIMSSNHEYMASSGLSINLKLERILNKCIPIVKNMLDV